MSWVIVGVKKKCSRKFRQNRREKFVVVVCSAWFSLARCEFVRLGSAWFVRPGEASSYRFDLVKRRHRRADPSSFRFVTSRLSSCRWVASWRREGGDESFRREANLNGYAAGKYPPNTLGNSKPIGNTSINENKENATFPIRTITLRGSNTNEVKREGTFKRLPDPEFQARKEKDLCFKCNEKYSTDHKCKMNDQREFWMFVVADINEEFEIIEEEETERKESNVVEVKGVNTACVEYGTTTS
ncbi:retrotransposon protein [Cucumis melo var. makuwa]|uniref:Retrotransposon protein n=1 Tax=Cucumis melo var. makuwa TaxID=1194695 RepID=A0A5D3CTQ4_CUCMM|nr:retrotransposon protein [Cucumis melo var. makuwa]